MDAQEQDYWRKYQEEQAEVERLTQERFAELRSAGKVLVEVLVDDDEDPPELFAIELFDSAEVIHGPITEEEAERLFAQHPEWVQAEPIREGISDARREKRDW